MEKNEDGGYTVTVPALPGCITEGVTWDEAGANAQKAISGYIEALKDLSKPIPVEIEPAANPSVEAYGDSVFCVWRGPHDTTNLIGNIWRRAHNVNQDPSYWPASPSNQSQSPDSEADFPVMATNFVTVWHEQVSPDSTQIWDRSGWDQGPVPLIQESLPSRYPQVEGYGIGPGIAWYKLYTLWTQQTSSNPPQYVLGFNARVFVPALGKGLGPSPYGDFEPALYYAAELGRPEQSPYCLSRGGFARLGSWNTDTSATSLTYRLPYLDPLRVYKLCAVLYHEGDSTWSAQLRCDSGPWHHVRVAPNVPDTFWLQVSKASYKNDARIVVEVARVTGGYVSLAGLKLYQIEEQPGDDGGVQSWGSGITYVTRLRGCSPNPFARGTSVNYELAQYGPVDLTVHDVSGRLIRRLESAPRQRGFHAMRWDGTDGRGHDVPAGVYFVRFSAGGRVSTGRLTLVR
jgi:antitoxin HicB